MGTVSFSLFKKSDLPKYDSSVIYEKKKKQQQKCITVLETGSPGLFLVCIWGSKELYIYDFIIDWKRNVEREIRTDDLDVTILIVKLFHKQRIFNLNLFHSAWLSATIPEIIS